MAAVAGVYRRALPSPPAIEFSSPEGKQLFTEALGRGHMEGFFKLISYYQTQSEPAYCGLASLAVVLNALAIDPGRKWKGPWRWFDDTMLDCCEPLHKIKVKGISFGKLVCLAYCNGAKVEAFYSNESTLESFRNYVISCVSSEDHHIIVSYHRAYLKQTGTGHFSPIGGYHAGKDLVLILDVARFKYPPHWVPLTLLWEAINTVDEATGRHRGFMLICRPAMASSILYTVSCQHKSWAATAKYLTEDVPGLLSMKEAKDVQELLAAIFTSAPMDLRDFINWIAEVRRQEESSKTISGEEKERLAIKEEVLNQVQETELYKRVIRWLASKSCCKYSVLEKDSLTEIGSKLCCQGFQLLQGKVGSSDEICCRITNLTFLNDNGDKPIAVISGNVITESAEQGVDVLVPCQTRRDGFCGCRSSNLYRKHPSIDDVLTVILLALPPNTWSCIKDEKLRDEILSLASADSLPLLLQDEVLHLRQQLTCLSTELGDSPS